MFNSLITDKLRRVAAVLIAAALLVLFSASTYMCSAAEISGYSIREFKSKVVISNENIYKYDEVISVEVDNDLEPDTEFDIVRKLPKEYIGRIASININAYDFDFDEETNLLTIHINGKGMNDTLVFEMQYTVNGVDFMGEKADYFDLYFLQGDNTGTLYNANIVVSYPEDMKIHRLSLHGAAEPFVGVWVDDNKKHRLKFEGINLPEDTVVSAKADLPAGYWANAVAIGITKTLSVSVLLAGIIIFILLRVALSREHTIEVKETRYAPAGLSPAHLGFLVDSVVDDRDIMAIFYYLAERGYMTIHEFERRRFRFTQIEYPKNETKSVRLLYEAIFDGKGVKGKTVELDSCVPAVRKAARKIRRTVEKDIFDGNRFYSVGSKLASRISKFTFLTVIAAIPIFNFVYIQLAGGQIVAGLAFIICVMMVMSIALEVLCSNYFKSQQRNSKDSNKKLVLSVIVYIVLSVLYVYFFRFAVHGRVGDMSVATASALFLLVVPLMRIGMKSRSKANAALTGKVQGLQHWIEEASKEEIAEQSSSDKNYYFRIMPYAFVLNDSRVFAGKFEYVKLEQPSWYKAYGLDEGAEFDIVTINSLITNLPDQLSKTVFAQGIKSQVMR